MLLRRRYGRATRAELRAAKEAVARAQAAYDDASRAVGYAGHTAESGARAESRWREASRFLDEVKAHYAALRGKKR